eukprot:TRINITY_DN3586_c0_g1_i10.p1 TRINITY_DN3586_c0_g1~~TRINITY_DN3586_c0_g1_i10.p1  ORF type:complete len:352 (+),score=99.28 TRINITY_DN3586_c0_g1_i10:57-1112(+)
MQFIHMGSTEQQTLIRYSMLPTTMLEQREKIPVEKAKELQLYKSDILDSFSGGWLLETQRTQTEIQLVTIYILQSEEKTFLFKSVACWLAEAKAIAQARNEYRLCAQCGNLSDGVAKLLEFREVADEASGRQYMELLYEHYSEDLYSVFGKLEGKKLLKLMRKVLEPLITMEENGISHADLNPRNIAVEGKKIKILNCGASVNFGQKIERIKAGKARGEDVLYCPPEVIRAEEHAVNKVDVYSWGMIFYQMVTEKTEKDLEAEIELRLTNHNKFLENLNNIDLKDDNGLVKEDIVKALRKALSLNYKKRPSFKEIFDYLLNRDYYKKKYMTTKEQLHKVTVERGKFPLHTT